MAGCSISSLTGGAIGAVLMVIIMLLVASPWVTITVSPAGEHSPPRCSLRRSLLRLPVTATHRH